MALSDNKKKAIDTQLNEWIDGSLDGDSTSNPMIGGLSSYWAALKEQIKNQPEEKQNEIIAEAKEGLKQQLVPAMLKGGEKGAEYRAPEENEQAASWITKGFNLLSNFFGGVFSVISTVLSNIPGLGGLIGKFTDQRSPDEKDAESFAAGAVINLDPTITVKNVNVRFTEGTTMVIANNIRSLAMSKTEPTELQKEAKKLDINSDGKLSKEELVVKDQEVNGVKDGKLSKEELGNEALFAALLKAANQTGDNLDLNPPNGFTAIQIPALVKSAAQGKQ